MTERAGNRNADAARDDHRSPRIRVNACATGAAIGTFIVAQIEDNS